MNRRSTRAKVAALGLVAVAASACGVHLDTNVRTVGGKQGQVVSASYATQAAAAVTAARTAHFTIDMKMKFGGKMADSDSGLGALAGGVDTSMSGDYDLAAEAVRMDYSTGAIGTASMVMIGGKVYMKMPDFPGKNPADKPWVVMDSPAGLGKGLGSSIGTFDPTTMIDQLKSVAGDLTVVGHETVDGVDTTHYHGTIDLSKVADLAKQRSGSGSTLPKRATDMLGSTGPMPFDVWLDPSGLPRKMTYSMSMGSAAMGGSMSMDMTMTLSHVGEPVTITAPPADQVGTMSLGNLGTATEKFDSIGGAISGAGGNSDSGSGFDSGTFDSYGS